MKRSTTFLLLAALGSFSPRARAENASHAAAGAEQAEDHFRQGTKALEAGRYSEAYAALRTAWELSPGYKNAAVLGQVELHLSQYRDAAAHLSYCLRNFPESGDTDARKHVEAGLAEAREHVAALRLRVDPEGSAVLVDGALVGHAPLDGLVFVDPGAHRIQVTGDGWLAADQSVDAPVKVTRDVSISLQREAAAAPAPGAVAPVAPPTRTGPEPAGGGSGLSSTAWTLIIGGSLTAVATGTAVVFALNGSSAGRDVKRLHGLVDGDEGCVGATGERAALCSELSARADDRNHDNQIATIAAVTAGVLGAATVGTAIVLETTKDRGTRGSAGVHFGAAALPGGGFFVLRGSL